ncbi:MAG: 1-deoxy-D-xylulose-5-phosphate reductoisomerase [Marinilabiliales bacterium]
MIKRIAILGATGSIGKQALEIIRENPDKFEVEVLTANNNYEELIKYALEFKPNAVVIANEKFYKRVSDALESADIKVYAGLSAINQIVEMSSIDMVLTAMVGFSGVIPTINAIKNGKNIALANKETLVAAGQIITNLAIEHKVYIIPVDSEHSAIFQCLEGESLKNVEKIYLTASGGPFRKTPIENLKHVKAEDALKHPIWNMGNKISIDSATMMNKGLEIIEAKWFFNLKPEQIQVIIHPESIIHSLVQFEDGSIKAQMGLPDMRIPIRYALSYPDRLKSTDKRFDFLDYPTLHFELPDLKKFRNIELAYKALKKSGNLTCTLNAANEIAVDAFLKGKISFTDISDIIEKAMDKITFVQNPNIEDLIETDKESRIYAKSLIEKNI